MDRREYLRGAIPVLATGLAGCADTSEGGAAQPGCSPDWSPSIEAEEPTLAPGETTSLQISVTNVTGVNLREFDPNPSTVGLEYNNATLTPGPDYGSDSYPPGYGWDACTDVEISIPVVVPRVAEPGEYTFGVRVTPHNEDPPSFERNFTITISGD